MPVEKRILVTGVGGFAGFHIAGHLSKRGHDVTGVARTGRRIPDGVEFMPRDLADAPDMPGSFDVIVHTAALKNGLGGTFRELWRNNVMGTANMLDFAVKRKIPRLIFFSSAEVFGEDARGTVDEDSPIMNPNPYAVSKYAAELLLKEQNEIKTVSLRLPGIAGPGASGIWLVNMMDKLAANEPVTIYSPEFETANFVHLDDLSDFVETLCVEDGMDLRTLVLACRQKAKIIDIVRHAKDALGSGSAIRVGEAKKSSYCLDASRAFAMGYRSMSPMAIVDAILGNFGTRLTVNREKAK